MANPQPIFSFLPTHLFYLTEEQGWVKFISRVSVFQSLCNVYLNTKLTPVFPNIFWSLMFLPVNKSIRNVENTELVFCQGKKKKKSKNKMLLKQNQNAVEAEAINCKITHSPKVTSEYSQSCQTHLYWNCSVERRQCIMQLFKRYQIFLQ